MPPEKDKLSAAPPAAQAEKQAQSGGSKALTASQRLEETPTLFKNFAKLPAEIRFRIWELVVTGNAVHGFRVRKVEPTPFHWGKWKIKLQVVPKHKDYSFHRTRHNLDAVSSREGDDPQARMAVGKSIEERANPEHVKWKYLQYVDLANDLVYFDLQNGMAGISQVQSFQWKSHQCIVLRSHKGYDEVLEVLRPFKKVGLYISQDMLPCYTNQDRGPMTPFACWCSESESQAHRRYRMCPVEVSGFLDCFENLEEFCLIVRRERKDPSWPQNIHQHTEDEIAFRSSNKVYWPVKLKSMGPHLSGLFHAIQHEYTAKACQGIVFKLDHERRKQVKFRCLVELPAPF